jgi:hypothetical protein
VGKSSLMEDVAAHHADPRRRTRKQT